MRMIRLIMYANGHLDESFRLGGGGRWLIENRHNRIARNNTLNGTCAFDDLGKRWIFAHG